VLLTFLNIFLFMFLLFFNLLQARHHTASLRNCFYLLMCCQLGVVLSSMLAGMMLLPPPLPPAHLLWLLLVALPLLAAGLMGNPVDPKIMTIITNKNKEHVSRQVGKSLSTFVLCA
jgi:hypothetical protein